jgi:NTE family protein
METLSEERKPLGLCLSGGGALGFAHIGVLKALLENGIEPQIISGSSMGAVVGSLYAAGMSPSEMMKCIEADKLYRITKLLVIRPTFRKSGFSTQDTIHKLMHELIPYDTFESLQRKLLVCVTNLNTMEWEIRDHGHQLADWVSASASIPGIFEMLLYNGCYYTDGGVLNNLPAQPLKPLCRVIIGVDVKPFLPPDNIRKPMDAIRATLRGIQKINSTEGRSCCSHVIDTFGVRHFHEFQFDAYELLYQQGYQDTIAYVNKHPEILDL